MFMSTGEAGRLFGVSPSFCKWLFLQVDAPVPCLLLGRMRVWLVSDVVDFGVSRGLL